MTNLCTKVKVRTKPLAHDQLSVYLDYYPAIKHPKTGRATRREFLGIYIYAKPKEKFEIEFNKKMLQKAEIIRCRRTESIINQEFGFLDRSQGKESFLDYFKAKMDSGNNEKNWRSAYKHFVNYTNGSCCFDDLSVDYCQRFLDYMLTLPTQTKGTMMASTANNNLDKLKCVLRMAFKENRIKENIAESIVHAKEVNKKREFLTLDEVKMLAATPCEKPVLKAASLFSCMTGLRISDILRLEWDDIRKSADGGWCMHIITKKTKTEAILPLSDEALELCGERKDGKVFEGLTMSHLALYLKDWIKEAGITKPISFHGFRHTFATLQLAAGTDLYTISKMLTHSNISTTQIYADVVNDLKRKAADTISLKSNNTQNND